MRRVWVTRAEPGAGRTAARLEALGFEPVVRPLLRIQALAQPTPSLEDVAALAFTSANGVDAFSALSDRRDLPVFTVGDATAEAARAAGFVDVASARGAAGDLAQLLDVKTPSGVVLVPGAREPAADLPGLAQFATVRLLPVYEAIETRIAAPEAIDAVLVHSARAASALAGLWPLWPERPTLIALSSAAAAPMAGLTPVAVAARPNEAALLEALGKPPPRL